ncbi:MAG TPA: TonB-dependent receptor [Bryobacterales bacterium]|nr:TonB-dependent receptor [Bryobacterales bacterium]
MFRKHEYVLGLPGAGLLLLLAAIVMFTTQPVWAQEVSAGITGRVIDPSGGAIVNAKVSVRDQDRGTVFPTTTNQDGIYFFPRIPIGNYELKIEAPGFKSYTEPNIRLEINQRARRDVQMEIGEVTQTVEVTAAGPLLQTETTQVGEVVTPTTIINTPLISRNFIALTLLAPGVTTPDPSSMISGTRTSGGGRPYVNGNRKEANNFLLDGIDNNLQSDNLTAYQPNLDAIQEFKMITNNASAEFGNFEGGVINVTIKSGTNDMHGDAFEFIRNDHLNADPWANNWLRATNPAQQAKPFIRWNEFGATLGGAIKKDKLFYFVDYQGIRRASPGAPSTFSVFPAEFRTGDFSRLLHEPGITPIQLYNPFSVDANGNRAAFPNNQIPLSLIDPVAKNLFANQNLYPQPLNSGIRFNQINVGSSYIKTDQGDLKLDYKPTDRDYFSARYTNGRQDNPTTNTFPLIYNSFNLAPMENGVINWTRTFSPTLVNEFRFGINNVMLFNGGEDKGLGNLAQTLGIQGVPFGLPSIQGFGLESGFGNANIGTQQLFANTTFHYADNVTIVRGRHMMKAGGQVLRQWVNAFYAGNNGRTGFIAFNGQYTCGPNPTASCKGFPEADFFLGLPNDIGRGLSSGTWGHRKTIYGLYYQDDWRATDTLTLNLGLRWEYHTPWVEVKDRESNFSPFTGALELAGQNGNSRSLYNGYKKDFQPRVGFAWTPSFLNKKTVFRGAYTVSSFMEGTGTNLRLTLNPPFNTEYETPYSGFAQYTYLPGSRTEDGMTILKANDPYKNATIRLWDPKVRPAEVQQWSLFVEEQLPASNVLSVGYVGQHGTHLIVPMPYFQRQLLPNGTTIPSPYLSGNPLLANIAQISGTEADGNQKYDSLQASLRKRLSSGLEYQISYTWSHGRSDAIGYYGDGGQAGSQSAYWQYLYNRRAEWGPTYFDVRHQVVASYVYDLPFGKGKKFTLNPVADRVFGNWQVGGILTLHTGFPLTIQSSDRSGTNSRGARADIIGNPAGPDQVGPGGVWFNTAAYAVPRTGTLGSGGPGTVFGPGLRRFDFSVQKQFKLTEAKYFEFRTEFYNLTNTPEFNSPSRNVTSTTFGEITSAQGERNIQFGLKFYF